MAITKFSFLMLPWDDSCGRSKGRLKRAFENFGLPFNEDNVIYNDQEKYKNASDYGYSSLLESINGKDYTAIIADTDRVALGVLRAARELRLHIPDELSLVCFE